MSNTALTLLVVILGVLVILYVMRRRNRLGKEHLD